MSFGKSWWGPAIWTSIHVIAASFPDYEDKVRFKHFKAFMFSLTRILPCNECRRHLRQNLEVVEPIDNYGQNRRRLFLWTWKLHNHVNKMLGKSEMPLATALNIYSPKNIDKTFWGRPIWKAIHSMASSYPSRYIKEYADCFKAFMISLTHLLPCDYCQNHLFTHLKTHHIDKYLGKRDDLFLWTWILHNEVNKHINTYVKGANKRLVPLEEARRMYGLTTQDPRSGDRRRV